MTHTARSLSQADDDLETLTSILNHDARSPLVSVMGFLAELKLLHEEVLAGWAAAEAESPERARLAEECSEAFSYLNVGAKKMARVLEVLGDLGGHRRRVLMVEACDPTALVERVAQPLRERDPAFELTVTKLPSLETDQGAFGDVFGYVLDNALRYRRPKLPAHVEVSADVSNDAFLFRVTDDGRGIAPSDHRRVFRPFVRVAPLLEEEREGTGLAHARALARRLGGDLNVESSLGEGSTFLFELPRKAPHKYPRHAQR